MSPLHIPSPYAYRTPALLHVFFFSSRRRHTRLTCDWSSDVCSSDLLTEAGADVQVVMTPTAARFVGPDTFAALTHHPVHSDLFDRTDVVLHVRLAHEADVAVVAPATANALARLALGLADDLMTSALLEATCPLVVAPAMHSGMWNHPATQAHVQTLRERGVVVVDPGEGRLAAGDAGVGRMAEPEEIA